MAEIVREAGELYLPGARAGKPLSFFGIGEAGPPDASDRVDEFVGASVAVACAHAAECSSFAADRLGEAAER